jgi:hypothetical protein
MAITATIIGGPVQLTGNPVWIHCTGGAAPQGSSEYKILLKIISVDNQLIGAPFIDAIAPDENDQAWFDISGYLDQPVKAQFQYPESGVMVAYPTQAFNIQVVAGESFIDENGDLQEDWEDTSDEFQLLKGGVSQRQISMWETDGTNFYNVYLTGRKWLTTRPQVDFVHPSQPVKLWFMPIATVQAVLTVVSEFDDGSSHTFSKSVELTANTLCEFNCNPYHHGVLIEQEDKRVTHYDVTLVMADNTLSDVRRFTIDWRYTDRPFYLLFANSIGGIDDVLLSGYAQEKFDAQGDTVLKPALRGDTVYDPTLVVPNRSGRNAFSISTGFKTASQMRHLRDLLVSRQVWLLYPHPGELLPDWSIRPVSSSIVIPVVIDNTEDTLVDHMEDLYSLTIEMTEAHNNRFTFDTRLY